jgi:protein-S-isoprenylcysteine O-methyltransferase Ste14
VTGASLPIDRHVGAGSAKVGAVPGDVVGDRLGRVALVGLFGGFGAAGLWHIVHRLAAADSGSLEAALWPDLLPDLAKRLFMLAIAAAALTRRRPVAALPGFRPRLIALAGTFFAPLAQIALDSLGLAPAGPPAYWAALASPLLILVGSASGFVVLLWLRRSFSIAPEARRLVTGGPYAVVRHPLYLSEALTSLGFFVTWPPVWLVPLFAAQMALQIRRMDLEERVLARAFPDYASYARRTARLIPGLY